jgi:hypothetical protein
MRRIAGIVGLVIALSITSAAADSQLAADGEPVRLGRCDRITRLISQPAGEVERIMKQRGLTPIELEMIVLPADAGGGVAPNLLITVTINKRQVRGIYSNLSGDGCMRPDHRFAVDRAGNIYQFDGPAGVVDYTTNRCHTARGWESCNLTGQTRVLYVVPARVKAMGGSFGSNLGFFPFEPEATVAR